MPEATVLYSVTAVVVVALVLWVAAVLKTAKEPWAREAPPGAPASQAEPSPAARDDADEAVAGFEKTAGPTIDADSTAKATPMALSEGRRAAAAEVSDKKPEG